MMWAALLSAVIFGVHVCAVPELSVPVEAEPDFDILKLTQTWPPAGCIYLENNDRKCNISSKVVSWIVHGLWPTKRGTEGPNFCNNTWTFNPSQVQTLRPTLDYNWPSITQDEKPEATWKHEWEKHGTCAAILPQLKNEFSYFNVTLGLHFHFDLSQILKEHGVEPLSSNTYQPQDLLTALKDGLGFYPSIYCVKEKGTDNFYMEEVEVCLDKTLTPVDCDATGSAADMMASAAQSQGNSLFFHPEPALQKQAIRKYINDCPDSGVFYKPFASNMRGPKRNV